MHSSCGDLPANVAASLQTHKFVYSFSGISQYSVREDLVTRGRPSPQKEDFLTVSGVPVELSRKLQVLLALSSTKTEFRALNMKQYDYDFGLERNVLATMETYDGRP